MDFDDVMAMPASEIIGALDEIELEPGWLAGDELRRASPEANARSVLANIEPKRVQAFQNLIVGTLAERVFREDHLAKLEPDGFDVVDLHEKGENRDYAVRRDSLELPINVKVASTLFYTAKKSVGLEPEDCVPISAYKAIGASERVPALIYVDLVDFTLREKVDGYMSELTGSLAIGWQLLSSYAGVGGRRAQDKYLTTLFKTHAASLKLLAPEVTSFRVISAQRVLAILRDHPRRVPGLGVKGAGTGSYNAEVNVHISVSEEMRAWNELADDLREGGIEPLLEQIRRTRNAVVPAPVL